MLDLDKIDFKKMGFQAGLEVHHQIDTKRKLFCNCEPILCDGEPDYLFVNRFTGNRYSGFIFKVEPLSNGH